MALRVIATMAVLLAACLPEGKPAVEFPPVTSTRRASLVTQLDEPVDARIVRVNGNRLLVADASGLLIYDLVVPAAPRLVGTIGDGVVDHVAFLGTRVYLIEVNGDGIREWDIADPARPLLVSTAESVTRSFGGIDARDGLVWHAVGSSPPSRVFFAQPLDESNRCLADDRERGVMDVWLHRGRVIISVHFDDFAGDGLDGNGGYGFALLDREEASGCPRTAVTDIFIMPTHANNRSAFEEPTNSDLQSAYDDATGTLYLTGEQQLRRLQVDADGRLSVIASLEIPEILDVEIATADGDSPLLGLANGDVVLVDGADRSLALADIVQTPGTARSIATARDGVHLYAADGEAGVAVIVIDEAAP